MKTSTKLNLAGLTLSLLLVAPVKTAVADAVTTFSDESLYRYNALENKNPVALFNLNNNDVALADTGALAEAEATVNPEVAITAEVDDIIEKQNYVKAQTDNLISKIEEESGVGKFLLGTKLGMLRFELVQVKDQLYRLKKLDTASNDISNKTKIQTQIELASGEQAKIENFVAEQENKFSLLGWFTKVL